MKKNVFGAIIITLIIAFFISGCMEPYYYQHENHRGNRYNQRHHEGDRENRN